MSQQSSPSPVGQAHRGVADRAAALRLGACAGPVSVRWTRLSAATVAAVLGAAPAHAATVGAAAAVQHKRVAELTGPAIVHRGGGPGLVVTARGDGRGAPRARLDLATTRTPAGPDHWSARLELERRHVAGPFYVGGRLSLSSEGVEGIGTCSNRLEYAPTAGVRLNAGQTRVRVGAGLPALGVLARRGTTALDPDLIDHPWSRSVALPAALHATGPWNAPAIDLTGRASWTASTGEAWVAVRTTVDRLDVGHLEQRVLTVQPEVGWSWGGGDRSGPPNRPVRRGGPVEVPPVPAFEAPAPVVPAPPPDPPATETPEDAAPPEPAPAAAPPDGAPEAPAAAPTTGDPEPGATTAPSTPP